MNFTIKHCVSVIAKQLITLVEKKKKQKRLFDMMRRKEKVQWIEVFLLSFSENPVFLFHKLVHACES